MKAVSQYDIETTNNNENSRLKSYLKCNFPMNPHVRLLVGWSVLKRQTSRSYWKTLKMLLLKLLKAINFHFY